MAIAIVLTGTGTSTLANSIAISANSEGEEKNENEERNENEEKELTEVRELKSERTENSNTYLMSDGSKKLEIYGEAIRYKKNGEWVDYDATLTNLGTEDKARLEEIVGENADEYTKVNAKYLQAIEGNLICR